MTSCPSCGGNTCPHCGKSVATPCSTHCYCQTVLIDSGYHKVCCKCGDRTFSHHYTPYQPPYIWYGPYHTYPFYPTWAYHGASGTSGNISLGLSDAGSTTSGYVQTMDTNLTGSATFTSNAANPTITVDRDGRITSESNTTIYVTGLSPYPNSGPLNSEPLQ